MHSRRLRIDGTNYSPMLVWNGERHRVRIRFRETGQVERDRGTVHTIVQRATGFQGTRRLTIRRALRGKWHTVDIGRRHLARRLMVEIELLAASRTVEVELDGHIVRTADGTTAE